MWAGPTKCVRPTGQRRAALSVSRASPGSQDATQQNTTLRGWTQAWHRTRMTSLFKTIQVVLGYPESRATGSRAPKMQESLEVTHISPQGTPSVQAPDSPCRPCAPRAPRDPSARAHKSVNVNTGYSVCRRAPLPHSQHCTTLLRIIIYYSWSSASSLIIHMILNYYP